MAARPLPVIEPRARIVASRRRQSEKIPDRALEPKRGWPHARERREVTLVALKRRNRDLAARLVKERGMHVLAVAPEAEERPVDDREVCCEIEPVRLAEAVVRPRLLRCRLEAGKEAAELAAVV